MLNSSHLPTSNLQSSNLLSMFQRKITHPSAIDIKILIEIEDNIPSLHRPRDDFRLATITIYTQKVVYQGELTGKCIIKQLAWTNESMNTLLECLRGSKKENNKVETKFYPMQGSNHERKYIYENICEISSGINLPLFSVEMHESDIDNPFIHMMQKFSALERTFRDRQNGYKEKEEQLKGELNEIEAVQKQIIYSSSTEIGLMKKEFIKHVNKQKAKIRKLMGSVPMINPVSGMIENRGLAKAGTENIVLSRIPQKQQEQQEQQRTQSAKKSRQIKKIDRQKYNKLQPQKLQVQDSSSQSHVQYYSQNSSLSSRHPQKPIKRQKPYGQKRKNRFTEDDDSSDSSGDGNEQKEEKTFLEMEKQRIQRENRLKGEEEGDVWEDLVI